MNRIETTHPHAATASEPDRTPDVIEFQGADPSPRCGCGQEIVAIDCHRCEGTGRRGLFSRRRCGFCGGTGEQLLCPRCDT